MTKEELIQFEEEIKELYLDRKIRSPVHLSRGNEEQLLEIFKMVKPDDWVFSTHRSHYHALLKGIDPEWLRAEILANRSIHINNAEHRFFTSAIVGGICPIALGVAMGIALKDFLEKVWCFVGDMAAQTGIYYECQKYAKYFDLPIWFVIEDNGLSVNTPTREVWGIKDSFLEPRVYTRETWLNGGVMFYRYERGFPHHGAGQWVSF